MEIAKEKYDAVMLKYAQLSSNSVEKKTAEAFAAEVKKSVTDSQRFADNVVNALSPTRRVNQQTSEVVETPPDLAVAREALLGLAKSVTPIVEHWRSFIEVACDALEVDARDVMPRRMVVDPVQLEKEFERLRVENRALDVECGKLDAEVGKLKLDASLYESSKAALNDLAQQLEASKKAQADLAAENEALKGQLAKATEATSNSKPHPSEKHHKPEDKGSKK